MSAWFQSLSPSHAAMALLTAFVLFCALYIAAVEWRRAVIRRRERRCLRVNRDYKRSIRSAGRITAFSETGRNLLGECNDRRAFRRRAGQIARMG